MTLTCSSDANPTAEYTWYKQDEKSPKMSGQNITINNIKHEHGGNYFCKVHNRLGYKNATVHVAVVGGKVSRPSLIHTADAKVYHKI